MPHIATTLGARENPDFQQAYWRAFESMLGERNAQMVKTMLLSMVKSGDTGEAEIDRVCLGLRITMGWFAKAIERSALQAAGFAGAAPAEPDPRTRGRPPPL